MSTIRRLILALALAAGIAPALAQVPPQVPALPDTERRTSYAITASTCACSVGFQLYGDSTDYANWLEVFVNGVMIPQSGNWTITSPTGSLATIPRPVTDAVLTFAAAQTGTVQIVGARRPRRTSQFSESGAVPTRNFNQTFSDITATLRELWDKTNDVTGRVALAPPGETLALLPVKASRANMSACFDNNGNLSSCVSAASGSFVAGSGILFTGTGPTTISSNIVAGTGIQITGTNPLTISSVASGAGIPSTDRTIPSWNGTGGNQFRNNPAVGISASGALTIEAGFGPTSMLYVPPNFANATACYGNGCTNLVHNAGTFTATITGTDMNVTSITSGTVPVERLATATLSGAGVTPGTQIRAFVSGTPGGVGHYTVTPSQTVASPTAMTAISLQGYYNTMVGLTNFLNATTASYNTGVGFEVMEFCQTCFANTAIGEAALIYNINGSGNTAVGWKALLGFNGTDMGDYNTAVGYASGWAPGGGGATVAQNVSVGAFSLGASGLSGNANVAVGYNSGGSNTSGQINTFIGYQAGLSITTGTNNICIGQSSCAGITTGNNNTIIGPCPGLPGATTNQVKICNGAGTVVFTNP